MPDFDLDEYNSEEESSCTCIEDECDIDNCLCPCHDAEEYED